MHPALTPADTSIEILAADNNVPVTTVTMFKELLVKLPDLIIFRPDETKADYLPCSKTVNQMVDNCDIYDFKVLNEDRTEIYAWPSTTIGSFKVYSDPPYLIIGRVNTAGFGVVPTEKLEDTMDAERINYKVVRKIREHLKSRPAIHYL